MAREITISSLCENFHWEYDYAERLVDTRPDKVAILLGYLEGQASVQRQLQTRQQMKAAHRR